MEYAKEEMINDSNKDDKIIYWSATDEEGKGYLGKYLNPLFKKSKAKEVEAVKVEENVKEVEAVKQSAYAKKKSKMGALFR